MVTAQIAWDLARQSRGRFVLGLSARSQAPVIEESDNQASDAVGRMREYIESLKAIWNTFQNDDRLRYRGQYYQFRLMAPFFNPGPVDHPDIPIYLDTEELNFCQLAGQICHGVHVPRLHTSTYLHDMILPAIARGLDLAGRSRDDVSVCVSPLIVTGSSRQEIERALRETKTHIAALAATAASQDVMRHRGWQAVSDMMQKQTIPTGRSDLWQNISDEMLREFAIIADPADIADAIRERYQGKVDRVILPWQHENRALLLQIFRDLMR